MVKGYHGKKTGIPPGATMINSASLPVFVDYSIGVIQPNVTYTATEWMAVTQQFNTALTDAMTAGVIIGFVVGIVALSAGNWWRDTGREWWKNHGNS